MSERYCRACGGWHDLSMDWPSECYAHFGHPHWEGRSPVVPTPQVIADTMEPVQSMLDGKLYDSKAALRATYRAAGVTEVGNDSSVLNPKPRPVPKPDRTKISVAVGKAFSRAGLGA